MQREANPSKDDLEEVGKKLARSGEMFARAQERLTQMSSAAAFTELTATGKRPAEAFKIGQGAEGQKVKEMLTAVIDMMQHGVEGYQPHGEAAKTAHVWEALPEIAGEVAAQLASTVRRHGSGADNWRKGSGDGSLAPSGGRGGGGRVDCEPGALGGPGSRIGVGASGCPGGCSRCAAGGDQALCLLGRGGGGSSGKREEKERLPEPGMAAPESRNSGWRLKQGLGSLRSSGWRLNQGLGSLRSR